MPATLCIWPNLRSIRAAYTPGHAALEIMHGGRPEYISWWPNGTEKSKPFNARGAEPKTREHDLQAEMSQRTRQRLDQGTLRARPGQVQIQVPAGGGLRSVWAQEPHHRVTLPGAGEGETGIGLNLERLCDWWHVFQRARNAQYRFVSTTMNCASVAGTALIAGGANLFAARKLDEMSHGWHTPLDVLAYGKEVEQGIRRVITFAKIFDIPANELRLATRQKMTRVNWQESMTRNNRNDPDLVAYPAWVTLSDRNIKTFLGYARRKDQLAKIDKLLQEYHGKIWTLEEPAGTWEKKVELLHQMLEQVHDHMREKPNSDRAEAVFILGKQIVAVIDRYGDVAA